MRKMDYENALIYKLPNIETLGCPAVICSDMIGIVFVITNRMLVTNSDDGTIYINFDREVKNWPLSRMYTSLQTISKIAAIYNVAGIKYNVSHYVASEMPTEAGLRVLVCRHEESSTVVVKEVGTVGMILVKKADEAVVVKKVDEDVVVNCWH